MVVNSGAASGTTVFNSGGGTTVINGGSGTTVINSDVRSFLMLFLILPQAPASGTFVAHAGLPSGSVVFRDDVPASGTFVMK